jgi:hypothetical protein
MSDLLLEIMLLEEFNMNNHQDTHCFQHHYFQVKSEINIRSAFRVLL